MQTELIPTTLVVPMRPNGELCAELKTSIEQSFVQHREACERLQTSDNFDQWGALVNRLCALKESYPMDVAQHVFREYRGFFNQQCEAWAEADQPQARQPNRRMKAKWDALLACAEGKPGAGGEVHTRIENIRPLREVDLEQMAHANYGQDSRQEDLRQQLFTSRAKPAQTKERSLADPKEHALLQAKFMERFSLEIVQTQRPRASFAAQWKKGQALLTRAQDSKTDRRLAIAIRQLAALAADELLGPVTPPKNPAKDSKTKYASQRNKEFVETAKDVLKPFLSGPVLEKAAFGLGWNLGDMMRQQTSDIVR